MKWKLIEPIERAPYITGCKDTHVLVEDERGERYFVPRKWLNDEERELSDEYLAALQRDIDSKVKKDIQFKSVRRAQPRTIAKEER